MANIPRVPSGGRCILCSPGYRYPLHIAVMIKPRGNKVDIPRPPIIAEFGLNNTNLYYDPIGSRTELDWIDAGEIFHDAGRYTRIFTWSSMRAVKSALNAKTLELKQFPRRTSHSWFGLNPIQIVDFDTDSWFELVAGIMSAFEFLQKYGINLAGRVGTVEKILGMFLEQPIITKANRFAAIGHRGGRNYLYEPGFYDDVDHWDLNGAYPDAFTSSPWPTKFSRDPMLNSKLEGDGIARATIGFKEGTAGFTTGPILNAIHDSRTSWEYREGTATLYAPFNELRMARDYGGRVHIHETFTGTDYVDERFLERFRDFCIDTRSIEDRIARKILKGIVNSCWSIFGFKMNREKKYRYLDWFGRRRELTYERDRELSKRAASGLPIATIVSGRVRERLYREALYPVTAPLLAKTDSLFAWRSGDLTTRPSGPIGYSFGQWSFRGKIDRLALGGAVTEYGKFVDGDWRVIPSPMQHVKDIPQYVKGIVAAGKMGQFTVKPKTRVRDDEWEDQWLTSTQA